MLELVSRRFPHLNTLILGSTREILYVDFFYAFLICSDLEVGDGG